MSNSLENIKGTVLESKLSESELEFLQSPQYQLKSNELQLIMSKFLLKY
jgi:hypothetical protein